MMCGNLMRSLTCPDAGRPLVNGHLNMCRFQVLGLRLQWKIWNAVRVVLARHKCLLGMCPRSVWPNWTNWTHA